jgi:hypothetical protein
MIMKTRIIKNALLVGAATLLMSFDLPTDWFKAGDKPQSYEMGIDKGAGQNGKNAATIKSIDKKNDGFGTLMQDCLPGKYLGKRIRMTGMLKTKDVSGWAGLWLRIDTKTPIKAVVFDNMRVGKKDRSFKGTRDWEKCEIILDVPANASNIAYGALISGTGQIWFDNLNFEIVATVIPTTGIERETTSSTYTSHQKEPVNLDFEK